MSLSFLSLRNTILLFTVLNSILLTVFFLTGGYPPLAISLHFLSVLFLWIYVLYPYITWKNIDRYGKDIVILFVLFLFSFGIRMYLLGVVTPGIDGDEIAVARSSEELREIGYTPFIFNNYGHGTVIPYLVGMSVALFGKSIEAIRLPAVLFGALGICAFYLLCRLFFTRTIAVFASLLFAFSYAHVALSRVIFEPTASIFFEILALLFFLLAVKQKNLRWYVALGLVLAFGNYTYLNFRLFTLFMLLLCVVIPFLKKGSLKEKLLPVCITAVVCVFSLIPLLHYGVRHPDHLLARAKVMSVFHQGLPAQEVINNVMGNSSQLRFVFLSPGDPNQRINPAVSSMVDIAIMILMLIGIIALWKKQKQVLGILLLLLLPFIFSDIFSYEKGEANTFYGFAHPNTLRISGILPIMFFIAAFGMYAVKPVLDTVNKTFFTVFFSLVVLLVGSYNLWLYFSQPYNSYTYDVNAVRTLDVVKSLNTTAYSNVYISPSIAQDPRFTYFFIPNKKVHNYPLQTPQQALDTIRKYEVSIIDVSTQVAIAKALIEGVDASASAKSRRYHYTPEGSIDTLLYIPQ